MLNSEEQDPGSGSNNGGTRPDHPRLLSSREDDLSLERFPERAPNWSNNSIGAVSALQDQKLIQLLAKYFSGRSNADDYAALAGKLTFGSNETGAELYRRAVLNIGSNEEQRKLFANAMFPESSRRAELYLRAHSPGSAVSQKQLTEIYLHNTFPADKEIQIKAAQHLRWCRTQLEAGACPAEARASAIRSLVRMELDIGGNRISTDTDLAQLLAVKPEELKNALNPQTNGLSLHEAHQRQALIALKDKCEVQALRRLVAQATDAFVRLENKLHFDGAIQKLSKPKEIAQIFGLSEQMIDQCIKLLSPEAREYRSAQSFEITPEARREELLLSVAAEIDDYRLGHVSRFRSNIELAKEFQFSPVAVYRHLHDELFAGDLNYRSEALRKQAGPKELELVSKPILEYVRSKISDHQAGKTSRVQTWEELELTFQVPHDTIVACLKSLSAEELDYRLEHIKIPGFNAITDRNAIITGFVKEEIKAYKNQEISTLSSNLELSKLFAIPEREARELLRDAECGLKIEEIKLRSFVLETLGDNTVADVAYREIVNEALTAKVRRELKSFALRDRSLPISRAHEGGSVELLERRRRGSIQYNGLEFDSVEEAAYAVMIERYCGEELQSGRNYQIRAGKNQFDFKIRDTIVECHPVLAFKTKSGLGDFRSSEEYDRYKKLRDDPNLTVDLKKQFIEETKHLLAEQYRKDREAVKRAHPEFARSELLVVTTPLEFYHMVLKRFADSVSEIPSQHKFVSEFEIAKKLVKEANPEEGLRYKKLPVEERKRAA